MRWTARSAAALLLVAIVLIPASASPPRPNTANDLLTGLMERWYTWALGGDHPDHFRNVQFLSLPAAVPVDGSGTADDSVKLTSH